ncbi:hypothetical protein ACFRAU_00540 [Arthrobacter sp. NPDC056691]|uniref:hypothetical protein n=1 Tax=Arthrobacter sp. NPDC056691 TaxID=3345913 RepID=UPI00366DBB0D
MTENKRPQGASAPPPGAHRGSHEPNPLASGQLAETPQSDTRMADDPLGGKQPADDPLGSDPLTLDRRNPPRAPGL